MSCYIHGWVEIDWFREEDVRYWKSVINIGNIADQVYDMYGYLFGVRSYGDAYGGKRSGVAPSRGLPPHCSEEVLQDVKRGDYHSKSWMSAEEFLRAMRKIPQRKKPKGWACLEAMVRELRKSQGIGNVRLVVWFDN
jgi:hypothetical protein